MVDIVRKLENIRANRGLSVYKVTQLADISQQTYYSWIKDNVMPSMTSLKKVCNVLGVEITDILTDDGDSLEFETLKSKWNMMTLSQKQSIMSIIDNYINNNFK